MKTLKNLWIVLSSFVLIAFATQTSFAQTFKLDNNASSLKIDGTSNIHDWTIEAKNMAGTLSATMENGELKDISQLDFSVVAESLKSGKSGMDKNTYKALKTDKHKNIVFKLNKVNRIDCSPNGDCKVSANGYLTIAGTRKLVDLTFQGKVTANRIIFTGSTPVTMTQYNVDPPTAMFGSITTGDKVNISFQAVYNK